MSNNKIKLVVEVDEYCRDAIIRHRNGTYGAQLPYYIISSAFEAIANGTSITEGDLIMFRTLMTEIANKGLPFEEVLLLIDNAKTTTEEDCISREALKKYARTRISEEIVTNQVILKLFDELIDDAPAVEPDLSNDLISRTELKKCAIPCEIHNGALTELCVPLYQIDNAPTVEGFTKEDMSGAYNEGYMCGNKEAINSRPQGKWVAREDMDYIDENKVVHNHFMCNKCGLIHDFIDEHTSQYNFCPNCGVTMRKGGAE